MLFFYVNNTDRTADVEVGVNIQNQLQQRTDNCSFGMLGGSKPTEYQDIKIYDGATIASAAGAVLTLRDTYETGVGQFRTGQKLFLRIGETNIEKVTVLTYVEATRTLTLTATPAASISAGDKIGELIFGGVVSRISDSNIHSLDNLVWQITGIDYTKIFDKKSIRDSWQNVDSRFIINSFVNSSVNLNRTLDDISYDDNTAIQAEFIEASDGANPTVDTSDYMEVTSAGVFPWTFAGGTAVWASTPVSRDISTLVGAASGTPTEGHLMLWVKTSDYADITSLKARVGSSASDYAELTFTIQNTEDWQYVSARFVDATITGTPIWTATDYAQIRVVETANGQIKLNGLRVNANDSFTLYNVESTPTFDDLRAPDTKPTELINLLAKTWENYWYIDYEHDIHFRDIESEPAPFSVNETDKNFFDLRVEVDVSNLGNRIVIAGGEQQSISQYAEVAEGDNATREWVLRTKFSGLEITVDNNTSTDTMEATTTTTTVKATAHGLSVGDHITNRTRGNAVRRILTVPDANTFTVLAVASQASGDTFSKFATTQTVGIDGIDDESTVQYVYNSNSQSVKATNITAVLIGGEFIRFEYYERVPLRLQYTDAVSVAALRALGIGDGIFDLDTYVNENIRDTGTALTVARAKTAEFSNAIVSGTFVTEQKGLRAGQIISVTDTTRNISDEFLIQEVSMKQDGGLHHDHFEIEVTFGTTLYGWIEFMQKLLRAEGSIGIDENEIINTFVSSIEVVETDDVNTTVLWDQEWKWEASTGQPVHTRWNLFQWG